LFILPIKSAPDPVIAGKGNPVREFYHFRGGDASITSLPSRGWGNSGGEIPA